MPPAKKQARCHGRSWSDLPHDLLNVILDGLTPAFGDRVRFRGVCQAWRAAELAHPRPTMPWLVATGHCVSLHDAAIHRVPLPEDATAAVCRGSFGDWLALVPPTGHPFMLNAFTMERITLPRWKKNPMVKFVLSSAPDSTSCTVAAILDNEDDIEYRKRSKIVVCRVGRGDSWRTMTRAFELHDIIFFQGKLHAVDAKARVHVFQDDDIQRDDPWRPPKYEHIERRFYLGNAKLHLLVLHGRLHLVGRAFGRKRLPGCTHFTSNVGVFALGLAGQTTKQPEPVKDLGGYLVFVGDVCCGAFAVDASSSGGKIRENQICFVDDEKKRVSSLALAAYDRRPFRQLQSYDVRNGCLRTYRPPESSSGTWRCVTAQRFPHSNAMEPPQREAVSEEELRLWDMANCLGATMRPSYEIHKDHDAGTSRVTVQFSIPMTEALGKHDNQSFTQSRPSEREARKAAAHEAATFLRSRFRSVLDDSPFSSVPHYHSHVDEKEEEEEKVYAHSNYRSLFGHRHWYGGYF
ncbi:hypothetical protein ACQ4PT_043038 [Festuca glaucescens]